MAAGSGMIMAGISGQVKCRGDFGKGMLAVFPLLWGNLRRLRLPLPAHPFDDQKRGKSGQQDQRQYWQH